MSGNPLVRFDEGRVGRTSVSPSLLLYRCDFIGCGHAASCISWLLRPVRPSRAIIWKIAPRIRVGM